LMRPVLSNVAYGQKLTTKDLAQKIVTLTG
jgi:hypothetical protein